MDEQLHSLARRLIELKMEHADLDALIDRLAHDNPWTNSQCDASRSAVCCCVT